MALSSCAQYQMPSVKQSTAIVEAAYVTSNQLANERRCRGHIMLSRQLASRFWLGRLIVLPQVSVTGRQTVLVSMWQYVPPA